MKLNIDFSELIRLGKRMSPNGVEFVLAESNNDFLPIYIPELKPKPVKITELDPGTGLIFLKGLQVLLYIRDHSNIYDATIKNSSNGNKYHIAWCKVLQTMRQEGRFGRYHMNYRLNGLFEIDDGHGRHQDVKLNVCKSCLEHLNYRGSADREKRKHVFKDFILNEFLANYSTCFQYMPEGVFTSKNSGYTEDWKSISKEIRKRKKFVCSDCGVDMNNHTSLCDVHHKDGVKNNNSDNNLEVLCRDCHRKRPFHGWMFLEAADMKKIQTSRAQQKLLALKKWSDVYSLTDTSLHGDLQMLEAQRYSLPELCLQINDDKNNAVILDAAWADEKIAINLEQINVPGWRIFTVGEVVTYINGA